jgi:hypothetical protein
MFGVSGRSDDYAGKATNGFAEMICSLPLSRAEAKAM